jgi:hypothetical protein
MHQSWKKKIFSARLFIGVFQGTEVWTKQTLQGPFENVSSIPACG